MTLWVSSILFEAGGTAPLDAYIFEHSQSVDKIKLRIKVHQDPVHDD